jgi:hypothetical protein
VKFLAAPLALRLCEPVVAAPQLLDDIAGADGVGRGLLGFGDGHQNDTARAQIQTRRMLGAGGLCRRSAVGRVTQGDALTVARAATHAVLANEPSLVAGKMVLTFVP